MRLWVRNQEGKLYDIVDLERKLDYEAFSWRYFKSIQTIYSYYLICSAELLINIFDG